MKHVLTLLLLALMPLVAFSQPPGNKNAQIELPGDMEISSKQRSVKVSAKTEATELQWIVINVTPGLEPQYDIVDAKSIRVYPNDADDELLILCYGTLNMKATAPVSTLIKVTTAVGKPPDPMKPDPGKPDPGVPDPGGPGPKSGKIASHVTFVVDNQKLTPEISGVINDPNLRKWILDIGAKLHSPVDVRSTIVTRPKGLLPAVQQVGGAPCVVIQEASGAIIGAGRLTDVNAVKNLIAPHTPNR